MEYLSWDLSILSRAVAYPNLSGASAHVGLSQPQLSRIIAKLEEDTGLVLLDRETRRKSSWTPSAYRLAEIYAATFQQFRAELATVEGSAFPQQLRIGTLEGLVPLALPFCKALLDRTAVLVVDLMVLDTNFLEERFTKGELDLALTVREPGRKKFRNVKELGYQNEEMHQSGPLKIFSSFEYAQDAHKSRPTEKAFVSNSLSVRAAWLERFGGTGTLPTGVRAHKAVEPRSTSAAAPVVSVMLIAHDHMAGGTWETIAHLAAECPVG